MVTHRSPFAQKRYEHDAPHVYFLQPDVLSRLEEPRPTFLIGTRGTGKTTLLKAMSAKERLRNASLRRQLRDRPFDGRYVGVYFKLPDTQLRLLDGWLAGANDPVYESLMSLYLDCIVLELLTESIAELIANGVIAITPEAEVEHLDNAVSGYREADLLEQFLPPHKETTARSLWGAFRSCRRYLERYAARGLGYDELLTGVPVQQAGKLVRDVSPGLAEACASGGGDEWRFYACMDEGEAISERQQQLLNTVVRLAQAPTYPIVAYVRAPSEVSFIPAGGLTRADREPLRIDALPGPQFRELVEGIGTARIQTLLKRDDVSFETSTILGDSRLDDLLLPIVAQSEAPRARQLLEEARGRAAAKEDGHPVPAPPIVQTYLELIGVASGDSHAEKWRERRDASAHRRKLMVASYLSICHELRARPRYASAAIVLQLCDGCVRDFLWQMDEIFRDSRLSVEEFLSATISDDVQDAALRRASTTKFERADAAFIDEPEPAKRLVVAIGEITASIQSASSDGSHLRSPERGIFVIRVPDWDSAGSRLHLIREAVESGYLQLMKRSTATEWRIRLHTSLAPRFGSSYRGAYYPVRLTADELDRLCYTEDPAEFEAAVRETIGRIQGKRDGSAELPLGE